MSRRPLLYFSSPLQDFRNSKAAERITINTLIVRVRDRDELFREACRIAVEVGGLRMSWIGLLDPGSMTIVPVASAGIDDDLQTAMRDLLSSHEGGPLGNTMSAQAIHDRTPVVSNDLQGDHRASYRNRQFAIHVDRYLYSNRLSGLHVR